MNRSASLWRDSPVTVGRILLRTGREFKKDGCFPRAAGLSYTTLLSLIPLLAVSFSIYSGFGQFEEAISQGRDFLFKYVSPASVETLDGFYDKLMLSSQQATAVSVIGMVVLIIAAWALLGSVENSLNHIWGVKRSRPLLRKLVAYTAVIIWTPLLIAVSISLTGLLRKYFFGADEMLQPSGALRFWSLVLPFLFTWGGFFFAYTAIPNRRVPWRATVIGSLVGGLLWELAKVGFDYYIKEVSSFREIYSALGAIPLFLLWVYYSWLIVLLGAELSFAIAYPRGLSGRARSLRSYGAYYALRLLLEVGRRFEAGEAPAGVAELSKSLQVDKEIVQAFLGRLTRGGLLVRASGDPVRYTLALAPARITLQQVTRAVDGERFVLPDSARRPEDERLGQVLADLRLEQHSVLSRQTLERLLEDAGSASRAEGASCPPSPTS